MIDKYLSLDIINQVVKYDTLIQFINRSIDNTKRIVANSLGENLTFVPINHISLLIDALRHYPGFESDKELLISKQIEEIKSIMHVAVDTGEIRDDLDIEITALNFYSISLGIALNLYTH